MGKYFIENTWGKAYMAPCTELHLMPGMELNVLAMVRARSAKDLRTSAFSLANNSYDGSPGWGGLTTQSIVA